MTTETTDLDESLAAAYRAVGGTGLLVTAGAAVFGGARVSVGAALGALLGLVNLWLLQRLVQGLLDAGRRRFAVFALAKAATLGLAVAALVRMGLVDVPALSLGFAALPVGVVAGGLWAGPSPHEER
ncbi:MAG: hypothetical protein FJ104_09440 [Deltaproteobacteria bacterium]|nr:hypothetical protein [Deltaproteobacteria bacterium]